MPICSNLNRSTPRRSAFRTRLGYPLPCSGLQCYKTHPLLPRPKCGESFWMWGPPRTQPLHPLWCPRVSRCSRIDLLAHGPTIPMSHTLTMLRLSHTEFQRWALTETRTIQAHLAHFHVTCLVVIHYLNFFCLFLAW